MVSAKNAIHHGTAARPSNSITLPASQAAAPASSVAVSSEGWRRMTATPHATEDRCGEHHQRKARRDEAGKENNPAQARRSGAA